MYFGSSTISLRTSLFSVLKSCVQPLPETRSYICLGSHELSFANPQQCAWSPLLRAVCRRSREPVHIQNAPMTRAHSSDACGQAPHRRNGLALCSGSERPPPRCSSHHSLPCHDTKNPALAEIPPVPLQTRQNNSRDRPRPSDRSRRSVRVS